jgi:hypothetical protein
MITLKDVDEVSVYNTTDTSLPAYSHSMLNAISTCPTYGLVTYVMNKAIGVSSSRAMALEAGSASHECYAAARVWQLMVHRNLPDHAEYHGRRLFGDDRYDSMVTASKTAVGDERNMMLRFCLDAFYTTGFHDDPSDRRRTVTNVEEALIAYLDRFDYKRDVWVQSLEDHTQMVGIEIPIDMTIEYDGKYKLRFIGTADGVTVDKKDRNLLRLEENKTAARLGEAWALAFQMSHQVTGYLMGLSCAVGYDVSKAGIHGMAIPLPRSYDAGGLMTEIVRRNDTQKKQFLEWVLHMKQMIDTYGGDAVYAPKYTGACNKYFRACSLIPLCASDEEDKAEMVEMMVDRALTPTEEAMQDDQ